MSTAVSPFYTPGDSIESALLKLRDISTLDHSDYRAVEVKGSKQPGHSPIFRNKLTDGQLAQKIHPQLNSLPDILDHEATHRPNKPFLTYATNPDFTKVKSISYAETRQLALKIGSGVLSIFKSSFPSVKINNEDFVLTIYAPNRHEWTLTDLAAQYFSITSTSLYDTLGPNSTKFILAKTKSPIVFLTRPKIESLLTLVNDNPDELSSIKVLVSFDKLDHHDADVHLFNLAKSNNIQLVDFHELINIGSLNHQLPATRPTSDTRLCICFTSGTSGNPKGVVLTQGNCIASGMHCSAAVTKSKDGSPGAGNFIKDRSRWYVLFPLAHIMERAAIYVGLTLGTNMFFPYTDDIKTNLKFLSKVRPNSFTAVPRIHNRIALALKAKLDPVANPSFKVKLINKAINYKLQQYEKAGKTHQAKHWLYDRLLKQVAAMIGLDETLSIFTGSAPMAPETINYLRAVFNIDKFMNGYGSTETFGGILMSLGSELKVDSVGPPGLTAEVRTLDISEMGYEWDKNRSGELLIRGPQVSPGYLDKEQTEDGYDGEGWLKTGDIVRIDEQGNIRLIDRRKNFFKLSQGEYITPEKIENSYLSSNADLVNQIWCYGDGLKDHLIGIVGLDYDLLKNYLSIHPEIIPKSLIESDGSIDLENPFKTRQLFDDVNFRTHLLARFNSNVKQLQGFERIKNIFIDFEPLKQENDTITQTLKVKRHIAKKVFATEIKKLYDEGVLVKRARL